MREVRRTTAYLVVLSFVPLVLLGFLLIAGTFYNLRMQGEQETLSRAQALNARIDNELMADRGAVSVLAGSQFIIARNWEAARDRALGVAADRPHWKTVMLTAGAGSDVLWSTSPSASMGQKLSKAIASFGASGETFAISGVESFEGGCRCVLLHQRIHFEDADFVLTVQRDVEDFQKFMLDVVKPPEVGALVDRRGLFIARSIDHEGRFGTPATEYVRNAVTRGGAGIYEGVTYEKLRNQTAYATSGVSGWSSHIAVPSTRFELFAFGSVGFAILSVFAAIVFAGSLSVFAFRELKARRMAERSQFQAQKLEAIGHLSGSVAHDFNNLLAAMLASLQIIERHPVNDQQKRAILEGRAAADRGSRLIQQLLGFAREKPLEMTCIDLRDLISSGQSLLSKAIGPGITLEVALADNAHHVSSNRDQLELALLNLATNARDAMPNGGHLLISSKPSSQSGCVDLVVQDTGAGMDEKTAGRAVEPYFTTKPEGKGTGLGLAQVQVLVNQSGGSLHLETSPGKGAAFILRLKACAPGAHGMRSSLPPRQT